MFALQHQAYGAQRRNFQSTIANTVSYLKALGEPDESPVVIQLREALGVAEDDVQENCDECGGLGSCEMERGGSWVSCAACNGTGVKDDEEEEDAPAEG